MKTDKLDLQGHRGARGLMPENTIPAFIKALDLGVTTLELDLAVSKDKLLVVSHEPYMNSLIALDTNGNEIAKENELQFNLYQMNYKEIMRYDVGSKFNPHFPDQEKFQTYKPLLSELIDKVSIYLKEHKKSPVRYNIEIKSDPIGDNKYHPSPSEYSQLVYDFIEENMDKKMLNIQSFDFRILQYFHKNYPEIKLAALVENTFSIDENLENLGFEPEIYSCDYTLLDKEKTEYLQSKNIKVIPWTVNDPEEIKNVLDWKVDGIISDYPNRVLEIISD
ncbi:MAG: glycerophosphodiester phosphodiesterase [Reichenbachiella sp.]